MYPNGRLEYLGYETFGGVLDYPVSAHPIKDGNDLLFHSYSVDEEVSEKIIISFAHSEPRDAGMQMPLEASTLNK